MIKIKRVYEKPDIHDGLRILVDRLWPRGIRRSTSNIDLWIKDVAPSMELRKWYSHEEKKWPEFEKNIILLDISEMSKRPNTLKSSIGTLREYITKINGDIAQIDDNKVILTPQKVKIIKRKKPQNK